MKKNIFTRALAMLVGAGLVCTTLPAATASAAEPAVNESAKQVLSLSTTTTTTMITTTTTADPVIDECYSTMIEYDRTLLAVGETMEVRFWNPETGECTGGDISEVSDNITYEYEEGTDTIYITALSAGVGKMYVRESSCAFGAYVVFDVMDDQGIVTTTTTTTTTAFTGTMTTAPAYTTGETTLRTTETMAPDETELHIDIGVLEDGLQIEFGQSLENVYRVMMDISNVALNEGERAYLRFDVDAGTESRQVLYPLSTYCYSSMDKWWTELFPANGFSYAFVRHPSNDVTALEPVSVLDVIASDFCDTLLAAVKASETAVVEIIREDVTTAPPAIGTTSSTTYTTTSDLLGFTTDTIETTVTDPYNFTMETGASVTVPVFYEDLSGTVETVTVDSGGTIIDVTKSEDLDTLINLHVLAIAPGEDVIRLRLDDGSEFIVRITVTEAQTTSVTTATTASVTNTSDGTVTTLPTTYGSTTTPPHTTMTTSYRTTTAPPYTIMTTTTTTGTSDFSEETCGDIDGSASIDLSDASAVLSVYAQNAAGLTLDGYTDAQLAAADVNGDGISDLGDASCILSYYAKNAAGLNPTWEEILGK